MRRDRRLTRARDFQLARRDGKSWSHGPLVLVARSNALDTTRFGFSVGRGVGKAVARNKVKRRLREAARLANVPEGWDIVFIARRSASAADFGRLERSMRVLLGRAGISDASPRQAPSLLKS